MKKDSINYLKLDNYFIIRRRYKNKNYRMVEIDGEKIKSELDLRNLFDKALKLPSYCGPNMNSVHDCFYDLEWTKNCKFAILIKNLINMDNHKSFLHILQDVYRPSKKNKFVFLVFIFNNGEPK